MMPLLMEIEPISHTVDTDGQRVTIVTLVDGQKAKLFSDDFHRIMAAGYSPLWRLTHANGIPVVALRLQTLGPSGLRGRKLRTIVTSIADLITRKRSKDCRPVHVDGDPLNLRRDNLCLPRSRTP